MAEKNSLDNNELRKILPQAHPFILIDRVLDYERGKSLVAIKNVTGNEWAQDDSIFKVKYFPETLLIEAAAQAAVVLYHVSKIKPGSKKPIYFLGRTRAEFFNSATVGDELEFHIANGRMLDSGGYTDACIMVGPSKIADMELIFKVN